MEDDATTAMVVAEGPLTSIALPLFPNAPPTMIATPPPANPDDKLNMPAGQVGLLDAPPMPISIPSSAHPDAKLNRPASNVGKAAAEEANVKRAIEKVNIALTAKCIEWRRRRQHAGQVRPLDAPSMMVYADEELSLKEELDNYDLSKLNLNFGGAGG